MMIQTKWVDKVMARKIIVVLLGLFTLVSTSSYAQRIEQNQEQFRVLLFTKSLDYQHHSVTNGVQMFKELAQDNHFALTWTTQSDIFDDQENLNEMDAIVFMNTSGDILNEDQRKALQAYMRQGGGFVAIHSASFTMMEWPWYVKLVGGVWNRHPNPGISTAIVNNEKPNHPATAHIPNKWVLTEEWYNYLELSDNIEVALTVDESTFTGGKMPNYHPIAWYQEDFEGGRSFHTGLGHPEGIYDNPWYRQHILGAVWWAATGGKAFE
ncbi:MAG: ThuA domain-containing protein [Proteobacteria bacterium]|nr:ThuA domain-containing protein [Pseudomonadota bacterium]